jgi:hypothetical protein
MAESKRPSKEHYAKHYPIVVRCAGLSESDDFQKQFDRTIRRIIGSYWAARDQLSLADYREALRQYVKGQAIAREALRSLKPIYLEIRFAAELDDVPEPNRQGLIVAHFSLRARSERNSRRIAPYRGLDAMTAKRDRGIKFLKDNPKLLAQLLGRRAGDYRKDDETALIVEPALDLLEAIKFTPSHQLTRKSFFDAFFDLIGVDKRRRPTHRSIDVIASKRRRDLKRRSKDRSPL